RGHPREDGLGLAAQADRQRQGPPEAGAGVPAGRRQAVLLRRLPRRGRGEPGPPGPPLPRARRLRRRRDGGDRRAVARGQVRGGGAVAPGTPGERDGERLMPTTVDPSTFTMVDFDGAEIAALADELAAKVGLGDDVQVVIEVDETTPAG